MSSEEAVHHAFNNKFLAEKSHYFFVHLYSHYMKKYNQEMDIYNNICLARFALNLQEVIELSDKTPEQQEILDRYFRKTFFINNDSTMNQISRYMEKSLSRERCKPSKDFDYQTLLSKSFKKPSKRDVEKLMLLQKEYKSLKRSLLHSKNNTEEFTSSEKIAEYINDKAYKTISSNSNEIADLTIYSAYSGQYFGEQGKSFVWNCFGKEILDNIKSKKNEKFVRVPMPNRSGNIHYLWRDYGIYMLNIEE